jgi:hypothetical protein
VCSYPGCHPQRTSQNRINQYCDKTIAPHKINGFRVVQGELLKDGSSPWILLDKQYMMKRWLGLKSDPGTAWRGHFYQCFLTLPHEGKHRARFSPAPGAREGVNIDPRKILIL